MRKLVLLFAFVGCAHGAAGVPKPVACLLPAGEQIAAAMAICLSQGQTLEACAASAGAGEILPYLKCLERTNATMERRGACALKRAAQAKP